MFFLVVFVLAVTSYFEGCGSQKFDRQFTGVTFNPYIKLRNNDTTIPDSSTYTVQNIRTMLEVISERFSNVATYGTGSTNVGYIRNETYFKNAVTVYIAETAAAINRDRDELAITIQQGVWFFEEPHQMYAETQLALECAQKANQLFPGTVDSFVFSRNLKTENDDKRLLEYFGMARNSSGNYLKLGVRMECRDVFKNFTDDSIGEEGTLRNLLVVLQTSDFVVCEMYPDGRYMAGGPAVAFASITEWLLNFRERLRNINSRIKVMCQIKWASKGYTWENEENLKKYWETAYQWAQDNNFPIWFFEAFDYPVDKLYNGWWYLTDNSKIDRRDGYIEKITEPNQVSPTSDASHHLLIIRWVSLIVIITLLIAVALLLLRVKKLQNRLSRKEIWEFMHGVSEEDVAYQNNPYLFRKPLQFSYDMSYEIEKLRLKINYDQILGSGQFGCVFKAIIESSNKTGKHVALKMAKPDCPKDTLKGLLSEIKLLTYVGQHPNIVVLEGAYTAELRQGIVYIATEYCCFGSLQEYLRKQNSCRVTTKSTKSEGGTLEYANTSEPVNFFQMVQWSEEIACGMEYLVTKSIVHADLATRNVLLNEEKIAKICDFGMSRRLYDYTNYLNTDEVPLPWRWMALESLNTGEFSTKSDVWGFGVTLWEIFEMGNIPYAGLSWTLNFVAMLTQGLRLERPTHATSDLYELMLNCWKTEADNRPSFSEIQRILQNIYTKNRNTIYTEVETLL